MIYGSKGILLVESNESSEKISKTLNQTFTVMQGLINGTKEITSEEKKLINSSSLFILFMGADGNTITQSLNSLEELIAYMKRGTTFSHNTPGVPISFKIRSLKDHKTVQNFFSIKMPINHFYIDGNVVQSRRNDTPLSYNINTYADPEKKFRIITPKNFSVNIDYTYKNNGFLSNTRLSANKTIANAKQENPITNSVFSILNVSKVPDNYSINIRPSSSYTVITRKVNSKYRPPVNGGSSRR